MSSVSDINDKTEYDEKYYQENNQSGDRIANYFFSDLMKRYFKKGKILEYGCGSGFFIQKFSSNNYQKMAHDISGYAMRQTKRNNPGIQLVKNPSKNVKNGSLNAIAALHVLEHIADPNSTLDMFHNKLSKDGILFFTVPNMSSIGRRMKGDDWFGFRDKTHITLLNPEEWYRHTENAGFEILSRGSDGLWDVPYLKYFPVILQKLIFYPTSAIQVWTKRTFLPIVFGENLIVIARKK